MPLYLTFSEQATGIILNQEGSWDTSGEEARTRVRDLPEAIEAAMLFLADHRTSEAWIGDGDVSYMVTLPEEGRFTEWISLYRDTGNLGSVSLGMNFGELVSYLGSPARIGSGFKRRPLSGILRYSPGSIDFHFDDKGLLFLVHDDDLNNPEVILSHQEE